MISTLRIGIALTALSLLVACGSSSSTTGATATTGSGGSDPGTGGSGGSGGSGGTGGGTGGAAGKLCNDLLKGDPKVAMWDTAIAGSAFASVDSLDAFSSVNTCACVHPMVEMGCKDVCKKGDNGSTSPNFCDGAGALTDCASCLMIYCTDALNLCKAN